jgi:hypothetical protein
MLGSMRVEFNAVFCPGLGGPLTIEEGEDGSYPAKDITPCNWPWFLWIDLLHNNPMILLKDLYIH